MRSLKQIFCTHWFEPATTREFTEYVGAIVCTQQKAYRYTQEARVCSKCGLADYRRVGEPVFEGWN